MTATGPQERGQADRCAIDLAAGFTKNTRELVEHVSGELGTDVRDGNGHGGIPGEGTA
ncbi:hypothetical protein L599_004900000100 [Luteimonas sp. J16]|nr:hypothetical protein L599_004900000100 [Luteimonas sp. J16]